MEQLRSAGSARDAVIVVRLPQELRDGLREQADREDRTLTSLIRVAARAYLEAVAARGEESRDLWSTGDGRADR